MRAADIAAYHQALLDEGLPADVAAACTLDYHAAALNGRVDLDGQTKDDVRAEMQRVKAEKAARIEARRHG